MNIQSAGRVIGVLVIIVVEKKKRSRRKITIDDEN
jgi:hypothetical protein